MKVVNVILSILIFLLAAVSAVFSYFLFEKRAQFVDGWNKMASAIYESSKIMDKDSGTSEAAKLTVQELAHEKYADLDQKLPVLAKQTKVLTVQRDAMAGAIYRIGSTVGMKNAGEVADYKTVTGYSARMDAVSGAVKTVVDNRNKVYRSLNSITSKYGSSVNVNQLIDGQVNALNPIQTGFNRLTTYKNNYRSGLDRISKRVGARVALSRDADAVANSNKIFDAVVKKVEAVEKLTRDLGAARKENKALNDKNESLESRNKSLAKAKADAEKALAELKIAVGVADDFVAWKPGSEEARERLLGKVKSISTDLGYLVIDLGKNSVVNQKSKDAVVKINLKIEQGLVLHIVRPEGEKREFKASITIDKVGDDESVANIPAKFSDVKVGDLVIYKNSGK